MWERDQPLVSIVTPCLNAAAFLERTIESVLAQDYSNIEYIVMDGGSTDGTLDILRGYGTTLRWVSGPDRGTADAINRGFELSQGEIFTYLSLSSQFSNNFIQGTVSPSSIVYFLSLTGLGLFIGSTAVEIRRWR